ncbi:MAG TPA: NAD(P)H-binding protein [Aquabacterium sp.]|uniref:NAD(P)H-binding protein n=1 Tax=Aquabacterium sp. TaxID=1872578 RepID=UPI002E3215D0|nr:NAD(P)H-binding protein [Aquabacterium sp.]HEX5371266.1 NAD(P)H-binding protein [Aquabacterium sp.]
MFNPSPGPCRQFRQTRVLIVGCGDVGLRAARQLLPRCRVMALTSSADKLPGLRAQGVRPLLGNLDQPASLARLSALAPYVLHLAPPPSSGGRDPRTRALLAALARRGQTRALVYGSTTGVYGDAGGAWFDETRAVAPATERAHRRVDAEAHVRWWGRRAALQWGTRASILRIPGIYALDREGGDPRDRVRRGSPLLVREDDVYTNHIQADDLARACVAGLWRGRAQRVVHACDDSDMRMGDYFDLVADLSGLPRLPRLTRQEAAAVLSPMQRSFMSESRRLGNQRLTQELRVRLRWPDVRSVLQAGLQG